MLKALIFDVDGTLADTETAHLDAFNQAFEQAGKDWVWDLPTYKRLLAVSGGKERILHYWQQIQPGLTELNGSAVLDTVAVLHELKSAAYEQAVRDGHVHMRPGILNLLEAAAREGIRLAIATTTSPMNISALLRAALGPGWQQTFEVVEDAVTAPRKKPNPQVYQQALLRLQLSPAQCLAFEDSANGLRAARSAGLPVIVTPNSFTANHDFSGALKVLPSLHGVNVKHLHHWHADATSLAA